MAQKVGTDEFFRRVNVEALEDTIICGDCARNECHNCKFATCGHVHYYSNWGSVAQIEKENPNLHWNSRYGVWEGSAKTQGSEQVSNLPATGKR